jgi:hypothetical protein
MPLLLLVCLLQLELQQDPDFCEMVSPSPTCFDNANNTIAITKAVGSPGACCSLCSATTRCVSWNFVDEGADGICSMFSSVGPARIGTDCVSGKVRVVPPTPSPMRNASGLPNIIFLVVESTDGRTWSSNYSNGVIPLPHIRQLQAGGIAFHKHYANAPVCCPSRATFWSGRHASNIPHDHGGIKVGGVWNNYEGLPANYSNRIDQVMRRAGGYNVKVAGKTDWSTGDHSENVFLSAWTMYVPFPYNISRTGKRASVG